MNCNLKYFIKNNPVLFFTDLSQLNKTNVVKLVNKILLRQANKQIC